MGAIYRPKYRDRHSVVRESAVWWVRFRQHGQTVRQSTEKDNERAPSSPTNTTKARDGDDRARRRGQT